MDISVVIPLFSEEESIPELSQWIVKVMNVNKFSYEVIFVDDGSRDNSWNIIEQLSKENNNIKYLVTGETTKKTKKYNYLLIQ